MGELVAFMARNLVENPDAVIVREVEGPDSIIVELRVAPEDMGKVIGKQGKTANAIRTIVKAAAVKDGRKVILDVDQ